MKKNLVLGLVIGLLMFGMVGIVQANTMTNFTGYGVFNTYTEDGILMTNSIGNGSWNAYLNNGSVHLDDGKVTLSMVDNSLFDLNYVSFDYNYAPVNFAFSNGNTWTLSTSTAGTVDFASLGIANGLQWFSIDGNQPWCTNFNEISMNPSNASVPEPATMLLFGTGLAGMGLLRKKLKV